MAKEKVISIPGIKVQTFEVTIEGISPLLSNRLSPRIIEDVRNTQTHKPKGPKGPKDPEKLYKESIYRTSNGQPGFPAAGIKMACVSACRFDDTPMTHARGAFYVMGDILPIDGDPQMREDVVRLKGSVMDLRYRAEYLDWAITVVIKYNPQVISEESIINLLETAGFHIGIGDWRPEKNGTFGMFRVQRNDVPDGEEAR